MIFLDEVHLVLDVDFRYSLSKILQIMRTLSLHVPWILMTGSLPPTTRTNLLELFGSNLTLQEGNPLNPILKLTSSHCRGRSEALAELKELLQNNPKAIVFSKTIVEGQKLASELKMRFFSSTTSDLEKKSIIHDLEAEKIQGLVATSSFGVGLDFDFELSCHWEGFYSLSNLYQESHRAGRKRPGQSHLLSFGPLTEDERKYLEHCKRQVLNYHLTGSSGEPCLSSWRHRNCSTCETMKG